MTRKRYSGGVTGFPCYKIQYWDEVSLCWVEVHRQFLTPEKANLFAKTLGRKFPIKYRIIELQDEAHQRLYEPGV
jgi:hypothetical protein